MLNILLLCALAYGNDSSVTLKKGEKAPFDGTLLSPDAVAQIITKADEEVGKCKNCCVSIYSAPVKARQSAILFPS